MIAKRSLFAHRNAINASAFMIASYLQSELTRLAFDFSARPERSAPWDEVRTAFTARSRRLWETADAEFRAFVKASKSKATYRLESSIMVEQKVDSEAFVWLPLTLRVKFYRKNCRMAFFEWKLVFDDFSSVYETEIIVESSNSKANTVLQRPVEKRESIEARERDFSAKLNDAVNTFLIFIESDEGKKALRLMKLTTRAVVISYTMEPVTDCCGSANYDSFSLQFDGFNRKISNSTYPLRGSNLSYGDGSAKHNLHDKEVIAQFIREFCRKHNKQPEDFLPFIRKGFERIAAMQR